MSIGRPSAARWIPRLSTSWSPTTCGRARASTRAGKSVRWSTTMAPSNAGRSSPGSGEASAPITASTSAPMYMLRVITVTRRALGVDSWVARRGCTPAAGAGPATFASRQPTSRKPLKARVRWRFTKASGRWDRTRNVHAVPEAVKSLPGSLGPPQPRRRELHEVAVWVAEVDAGAATGPADSPFDRDAALAEPRLPGREIHLGDREGEVQVAAAVVGRDDAEGEAGGLSGAALLEQEQHLVSRHLERREARVAVELREAEQRLVELRGAPHVGHVQRRLEHPGDAGQTAHTSSPRSTVTAWPPSPTRSPASRTRTTPPRGDAWYAVISVLCSRSLQNGVSAQCAEPVTGSSGTPACGAKKRETKSKSRVPARLVTMIPRASTRWSAAMSGTRLRTVSSESTSTR